jgi:hypothetical protein
MAISNVFLKDPNATLDYGFDWSEWLNENEILTGYQVTSGCGITNLYNTYTTAGSVIVWLSGGVPGNRYSIACKIETSGSRIDERTIKIDVRER